MPQKWLLPVDGSEASLRAVRLAIEDASFASTTPDLLLVNVQSPVSGDVSRFINAETLKEFHEENGNQALAGARAALDASGLRYASRVVVGEIPPTIADLARRESCTRIVMGTSGLGSVIGMLMGTVTTKVVHLSPVPVLLVK